MVREGLEVGHPMGIHGPAGLEGAADPRPVVLFALLGVGVDGVVHEDDARPLLGQFIHLLPPLAHDAGAVGVDHQALDAVEHGLVLGPARDDGSLEPETALLVDGLGKQLATGVELVLAGSMAPAAGQEDDVGGGGGEAGGREQHEGAEGAECDGHHKDMRGRGVDC